MFSKTIAEPALGLANVQESTPGTADTVDEVGGGASEPLPHLKGLSGSQDDVQGPFHVSTPPLSSLSV